MQNILIVFSMLFAITFGYFSSAHADGYLTEQDKINLLLNSISDSHVTFIRNGQEYDANKAKEHMETKLKLAGPMITTAQSFIENVASHSYLSGQPYYVKLPSGEKMTSGTWLTEKLYDIENLSTLSSEIPAKKRAADNAVN